MAARTSLPPSQGNSLADWLENIKITTPQQFEDFVELYEDLKLRRSRFTRPYIFRSAGVSRLFDSLGPGAPILNTLVTSQLLDELIKIMNFQLSTWEQQYAADFAKMTDSEFTELVIGSLDMETIADLVDNNRRFRRLIEQPKVLKSLADRFSLETDHEDLTKFSQLFTLYEGKYLTANCPRRFSYSSCFRRAIQENNQELFNEFLRTLPIDQYPEVLQSLLDIITPEQKQMFLTEMERLGAGTDHLI
jgi:hypothetical protein